MVETVAQGEIRRAAPHQMLPARIFNQAAHPVACVDPDGLEGRIRPKATPTYALSAARHLWSQQDDVTSSWAACSGHALPWSWACLETCPGEEPPR